MGHALQLVNIARDVKKDALNNRVYIPLSSFPNKETILAFLHPQPDIPTPSPKPYVMELVEYAFILREKTAPYMDKLPREARGGLRAMVASYFEIAEEIVRREGEVDERGVKVSKWRRLRAAASAMWGFA
jgi:15-cis-phytoene synthase/lycopene beta-cyclase